MYQLVSAIVKPLDGNGRWRSMDIGSTMLRDLFNDYKRVSVTLSNPVLPNHVSLDMEQLRTTLGGSSQPFNAWLGANGNLTLPTSTTLPVINTRYAKFSDAVRSGYTVTPIHPTITNTGLSIFDKPDLLVTKAGANYSLIGQHCLANVNGFYHRTDYSSTGLFVVDGMHTCLHAKRNELGLLSFLGLGAITLHAITDNMIYTQRVGEVLRNNCYVDLGIDVSHKTVMLVLGGYLHVLDKRAFFRISPTAFGIDFSQIPMVDRFYESHKTIDLTALQMETAPTNPDQISVNNLLSDAVLRKYLKLSQTFIVVLDNDDIFLDSIELRASPFPGTYTAFTQPIYPLITGRGKHEVYWPRKEDDRYSVNISAAWEGTPNYDSVVTLNQHSVSDAQMPSLGYGNTAAHFLLIGSDV